MLCYLSEVMVAGGQLGPGVADPDDGPILKQVLGESLVLHPAAVNEAVFVRKTEPFLAAKFLSIFGHPQTLPYFGKEVPAQKHTVAKFTCFSRSARTASRETASGYKLNGLNKSGGLLPGSG